jgi:hypothetical protein
MRTQERRISFGAREIFSALFVTGVVLISAVGCDFTKAPQKQSQTAPDSMGVKIVYSEHEIKGPITESAITRTFTKGSSFGNQGEYRGQETLTLSDDKYMYLEFERPKNLTSLEDLVARGEVEWAGVRHGLQVDVQTESKNDKTIIRLRVSDVANALGQGKEKLSQLSVELMNKKNQYVSLSIPARRPPTEFGVTLQSLGEYVSENPKEARDSTTQYIRDNQLTLVQVATLTNLEETPIKLRVARRATGSLYQALEVYFGPSVDGWFQGCPGRFGKTKDYPTYASEFLMLPVDTRLGMEAQTSLAGSTNPMVLLMKPKESLKIGIYALGRNVDPWLKNGPVLSNSGPVVFWCPHRMWCHQDSSSRCINELNRYEQIQERHTIGEAGPTKLEIYVVDIDGLPIKALAPESIIRASYFEDFRVDRNPPSHRLGVFRARSNISWAAIPYP